MSGEPEMSLSPDKKPWLLEACAVLLLFPAMLVSGMVASRKVGSAAELMGSIFAPAILALVAVGIARAVNRGLTRRGQAKVTLGTLLFVITGQCGALGRPPEQAAETSSERAARFAAEGSKVVPRKVDEETTLLSVTAQGATLTYHYRMEHLAAADADPVAVEDFKVGLTKNVCTKPASRTQMLKQGLTVQHSYRDAQNDLVMAVTIDERLCQSLENAGRLTMK